MKTKIHLALFFLATASAAEAQELTAREDNPAVREKFKTLRESPPAEIPVLRPQVVPGTEVTQVLLIDAVIDRALLVSFPVDSTNLHLVEGTGASHVSRKEDVAHHTIFQGRYYRLLKLSESAPDDIVLEKFVGLPMKLDIVQRSDGRQVVLDVRRP